MTTHIMSSIPRLAKVLGLFALHGRAFGADEESGKTQQEPEAPAAQTATAAAPTPRFQLVAFTDADLSQNCDERSAIHGVCMEEVRLLDLGSAWVDEPADRGARARMRVTSRLYARLWDDVALRWGEDAGHLAEVYAQNGMTTLPWPDQLWESSTPSRAPRHSLPDPSIFVPLDFWMSPDASVETDRAPTFPHLVQAAPPGVEPRPELTLIQGKFAGGLRAGGRSYPYDLMDGDPTYSGPFLEQMFPFPLTRDELLMRVHGIPVDTSCEAMPQRVADAICPPNWRFQVPDALEREGPRGQDVTFPSPIWQPVTLSRSAGYEGLRAAASTAFNSYFNRVASALERYGAAEYTETHLRTLAALLAMHVPPDADTRLSTTRRSGDNPSTPGETDSSASIEETIRRQVALGGGAARMSVAKLPIEVVEPGLRRTRLALGGAPSPELVQQIHAAIRYTLRDNIRQDCPLPVQPLFDPAGLDRWAVDCAMQGQDPAVANEIKRIALSSALDELGRSDPMRRAAEETWLLMANVELGFLPELSKLAQSAATPRAVQEAVTHLWSDTLEVHGTASRQIPQGPGAPNPLAVCGQITGAEALDESSIRSIRLDVLVSHRSGIKSPGELLWEARDRLPFQMIDSPVAWNDPQSPSDPKVDVLVELPGGRSLYRIQWRLWSGWHLLWRAEDAPGAPSADLMRLSAQTAALCSDIVLAEPALVPSLIRGALLADPLRGTLLARETTPNPRQAAPPKEEGRTNDELVEGSVATGREASATASRVESLAESLLDDPSRLNDVASSADRKAAQGLAVPERLSVEDKGKASRYMRDLLVAAVEPLPKDRGGLTLITLDVAEGASRRRTWQLRPGTPYLTAQRRKGGRAYTRAAMWAVHLPAEVAPDTTSSWELVSPDFAPSNSVRTGAERPKWKRHDQIDFWLVGSGGPAVQSFSYASAAVERSLEDPQICSEQRPDDNDSICTEVWQVTLDGLLNWWWLDQPRLALELGPTLELHRTSEGEPWFASDQDWQPSPFWEFRGGMTVGARIAPGAAPLRVSLGQRYPWGSERPDARALLRRSQGGLRVSGTIGATEGPIYGDLSTAIWWGWSLRRQSARGAALTPYRPGFVLGPALEVSAGWPIAESTADATYPVHSRYAIGLSLTGQLRLGDGLPEIPEAE